MKSFFEDRSSLQSEHGVLYFIIVKIGEIWRSIYEDRSNLKISLQRWYIFDSFFYPRLPIMGSRELLLQHMLGNTVICYTSNLTYCLKIKTYRYDDTIDSSSNDEAELWSSSTISISSSSWKKTWWSEPPIQFQRHRAEVVVSIEWRVRE